MLCDCCKASDSGQNKKWDSAYVCYNDHILCKDCFAKQRHRCILCRSTLRHLQFSYKALSLPTSASSFASSDTITNTSMSPSSHISIRTLNGPTFIEESSCLVTKKPLTSHGTGTLLDDANIQLDNRVGNCNKTCDPDSLHNDKSETFSSLLPNTTYTQLQSSPHPTHPEARRDKLTSERSIVLESVPMDLISLSSMDKATISSDMLIMITPQNLPKSTKQSVNNKNRFFVTKCCRTKQFEHFLSECSSCEIPSSLTSDRDLEPSMSMINLRIIENNTTDPLSLENSTRMLSLHSCMSKKLEPLFILDDAETIGINATISLSNPKENPIQTHQLEDQEEAKSTEIHWPSDQSKNTSLSINAANTKTAAIMATTSFNIADSITPYQTARIQNNFDSPINVEYPANLGSYVMQLFPTACLSPRKSNNQPVSPECTEVVINHESMQFKSHMLAHNRSHVLSILGSKDLLNVASKTSYPLVKHGNNFSQNVAPNMLRKVHDKIFDKSAQTIGNTESRANGITILSLEIRMQKEMNRCFSNLLGMQGFVNCINKLGKIATNHRNLIRESSTRPTCQKPIQCSKGTSTGSDPSLAKCYNYVRELSETVVKKYGTSVIFVKGEIIDEPNKRCEVCRFEKNERDLRNPKKKIAKQEENKMQSADDAFDITKFQGSNIRMNFNTEMQKEKETEMPSKPFQKQYQVMRATTITEEQTAIFDEICKKEDPSMDVRMQKVLETVQETTPKELTEQSPITANIEKNAKSCQKFKSKSKFSPQILTPPKKSNNISIQMGGVYRALPFWPKVVDQTLNAKSQLPLRFEIVPCPPKLFYKLQRKMPAHSIHIPITLEEVRVLGNPNPCPDQHCKLSIFFSDFTRHIRFEHSNIDFENIKIREPKTVIVDLTDICINERNIRAFFLLEDKISGIINHDVPNKVPLVLMCGRFKLNIKSDGAVAVNGKVEDPKSELSLEQVSSDLCCKQCTNCSMCYEREKHYSQSEFLKSNSYSSFCSQCEICMKLLKARLYENNTHSCPVTAESCKCSTKCSQMDSTSSACQDSNLCSSESNKSPSTCSKCYSLHRSWNLHSEKYKELRKSSSTNDFRDEPGNIENIIHRLNTNSFTDSISSKTIKNDKSIKTWEQEEMILIWACGFMCEKLQIAATISISSLSNPIAGNIVATGSVFDMRDIINLNKLWNSAGTLVITKTDEQILTQSSKGIVVIQVQFQ